jgi:hypothetical protein
MPTGAGLDAQLAAKFEATYGTAVTVDRFWEFTSESLAWTPTFREPSGLRSGRLFKSGSALQKTREGVSGGVELQHSTRDMGFWWKLALFSAVSAPTALTAPASKQIHTPSAAIPSATIQVGRPEPQSMTVRPHTYAGCVCTGWELSVSDGETVNLSLDLDGRSESTATGLAAASYTSGAEVFAFQHASVFKVGGVASTAGGAVSIAGGTAVSSVVTEFSVSGDNSLALERFGLGNSGLKNAPRVNDFFGYTGSMTAEYLQSEWYTPFKAGTKMPLQLSFISSPIGASGSSNTLDLVIPQVIIKSAPVSVGGPDLLTQTVEFEVYDDGSNTPIQVTLISADPTTAL